LGFGLVDVDLHRTPETEGLLAKSSQNPIHCQSTLKPWNSIQLCHKSQYIYGLRAIFRTNQH
jgi:hypothetical protein